MLYIVDIKRKTEKKALTLLCDKGGGEWGGNLGRKRKKTSLKKPPNKTGLIFKTTSKNKTSRDNRI